MPMPPQKINGVIYKQQQKEEIQKRLRTKESKKARDLLSMAMSNLEALKFVQQKIEEDIERERTGNS